MNLDLRRNSISLLGWVLLCAPLNLRVSQLFGKEIDVSWNCYSHNITRMCLLLILLKIGLLDKMWILKFRKRWETYFHIFWIRSKTWATEKCYESPKFFRYISVIKIINCFIISVAISSLLGPSWILWWIQKAFRPLTIG